MKSPRSRCENMLQLRIQGRQARDKRRNAIDWLPRDVTLLNVTRRATPTAAAGRRRGREHRNSAQIESTCGEHLRMSKDRVRSSRSRVFNDLCRAREYAARCNALNGADALSIPLPYNLQSSYSVYARPAARLSSGGFTYARVKS